MALYNGLTGSHERNDSGSKDRFWWLRHYVIIKKAIAPKTPPKYRNKGALFKFSRP